MRLHPLFAVGVLGLLAATGRAEQPEASPVSPPSPLRLVPVEADLLLHVREPQRLAEHARKLEALSKLLEFPAIKEQLDGTVARRGRQLLAYFEKALGAKWPELLDQLAGGGVALGTKVGSARAPFLLVVQGKDARRMKRFVQLAAELIEAELARQESKDRLEKFDCNGVAAFKVGNDLWVARADAALVVSNKKDALARALDLHTGKQKKSMASHAPLIAAGKLLPRAPLAEAWLNMKPIQQSAEAKALYKSPRDNFLLTLFFGGYLDVFGRAPYLCAALSHDSDGYRFAVRAPVGRDGMGADRGLHVPARGEMGCRPLLEPKGVLYSVSFFFDFARLWTDRNKLFPRAQADGLTKFDEAARLPLLGTKFSALLQSVGARQRVVVANQARPGYRKRSGVTIPAFAFVAEARKPDRFARTIDALVRAAAVGFTNQIKMKLAEEKYGEVPIVGYRFDEAEEVKEDVNNIRFAFSPCWARVGDQFAFCSTIELCRDLIDTLKAEQKAPGKSLPYKARDRYYSPGFADLLVGVEDQLVTQAILDQAIAPAEAKKQVEQFVALVRSLGRVSSFSDFDDSGWRYEFRFGK